LQNERSYEKGIYGLIAARFSDFLFINVSVGKDYMERQLHLAPEEHSQRRAYGLR